MEQKNQDFEQEKPHFGAGKSILGAVKMIFGAREKNQWKHEHYVFKVACDKSSLWW